tara:strand:- start:1217 stop:1465 length:249 start_codon:yes stop_codon:yes gene_type:complete
MTTFYLEEVYNGRRVYEIKAESKEEAVDLFDSGKVSFPHMNPLVYPILVDDEINSSYCISTDAKLIGYTGELNTDCTDKEKV